MFTAMSLTSERERGERERGESEREILNVLPELKPIIYSCYTHLRAGKMYGNSNWHNGTALFTVKSSGAVLLLRRCP